MAKRKPQSQIPDDWLPADGRRYYILCAPKSQMWDIAVRSAIFQLTRGRYWDGDTGLIVPTQMIAREIYKNMANCDDLVLQLQAIAQAITDGNAALAAAIGALTDSQGEINITNTVRNQIAANASATAATSSFAESFSYSSAAAVTFPILMPPNILPPVDADDGPTVDDGPEFGYTDTPVVISLTEADDIACQVSWDITRAIERFLELGWYVFEVTTGIVPLTTIMQLLASVALELQRDTDKSWPFVLPKPVAAALAAGLAGAGLTTRIGDHLYTMYQYVADHEEDLSHLIYCVASENTGTAIGAYNIGTYIAADIGEGLTALQAAQLSLLFGPAMIASVLYERVDYVAPTVNTEFCFGCGQ